VDVISLHHKKHIRRNKPSAIQAAHFLSLNLPRAKIINTNFFADKQKKNHTLTVSARVLK